jgi:hypothetical protein
MMLLYRVVQAYALIGAIVAFAFILWGVDRVDPAARHAIAFRPLLLPGAALLWPVVLARWIALQRRQSGEV